MVFISTVVVLQSISFSNYALTTKTTNIIQGSAPYLTFDGGRTRVTNTEALLGISLSDGRTFTPTTNNSRDNPIVLPVAGQSFADIGMLIPTDTNSIALSSLIGTPYNYWGNDDGDGQGINGITATGSLNLSIVDKRGRTVARNEVLNICKGAPYKLTLSNTDGTLKTRYGVPNESHFSASNATYYINPKEETRICYARPDLTSFEVISTAVWIPSWGFLPQSFTPSSYGLNFPTTGANKLYFDLYIGGISQALSWASVSHGGITATMTNSTSTSVRVTLTGPVATESQWQSDNPGRIDRLSLPQVFELVGRDNHGNAVVKYGFKLKQWFVNRGNYTSNLSSLSSWCNKIGGYRVPNVSDLTNASCRGNNTEDSCNGLVEATPSSPDSFYSRYIGAGFFTEWGYMVSSPYNYPDANFNYVRYWANDKTNSNQYSFIVDSGGGFMLAYPTREVENEKLSGVCTYP